MNGLNISAAHAVNAQANDKRAEQQALAKAGTAFEALILEKLLASARTGSASGAGQWHDLANRALAESLADASPLGVKNILKETAR